MISLEMDFLESISKEAEIKFKKSHSVLSFNEYLTLLIKNPSLHLRNSAQYFVHMVEYYGAYEKADHITKYERYKLFDAEFNKGCGKIFGQEQVQEAIINNVKNFVSSGKIDKLILLHGPNGSAKTSIIQALVNAMEDYSKSDEGAIYNFSWVFPKKEVVGSQFGFAKTEIQELASYAHLPSEALNTKLVCEEKDHPLFLLSLEERDELFKQIKIIKIPEILKKGQLSYKNKQIFDALLLGYNGDLKQVFKHVRIERFYFSKRYRSGLSIVEPQMSVDASVRQITADQSLLALPSILNNVSLYEAVGPLVDANRGMIEYSDLLKRPIDAWKYLLIACEQAQVSIGWLNLFFDTLLFATSNELHLVSFKEYPDWQSFKGRIELIRVPYLLNACDEAGIYYNHLHNSISKHIAPHAIELAARWAVLTRLEPPDEQKYPSSLQEIIKTLTPEEKLDLYTYAQTPARITQSQSRELKKAINLVWSEYKNHLNYEGRFGASPREILYILYNASQDKRYEHLSVLAVFEQIEILIQQKSSYEFLRREAYRTYRDASSLLNNVKKYYSLILEDEVRNALGLYSKESYVDLFTRYVLHVSAWVKKERLMDPIVGKPIHADENFMQKIEVNLLAPQESFLDFRNQIITSIAASNWENPEVRLDYNSLFSGHLRKLKEKVYQEQYNVVHKIIHNFLLLLKNDYSSLNEKELNQAKSLQTGLIALGYNESSSKEAMVFLAFEADKLSKVQQQESLGL